MDICCRKAQINHVHTILDYTRLLVHKFPILKIHSNCIQIKVWMQIRDCDQRGKNSLTNHINIKITDFFLQNWKKTNTPIPEIHIPLLPLCCITKLFVFAKHALTTLKLYLIVMNKWWILCKRSVGSILWDFFFFVLIFEMQNECTHLVVTAHNQYKLN